MALELFKPHVINGLVTKEIASNIKAAKRMIENQDERVWDIVEEKILTLTHEGGLYLMRLEYITELKTREEIKNRLQIGSRQRVKRQLVRNRQ